MRVPASLFPPKGARHQRRPHVLGWLVFGAACMVAGAVLLRVGPLAMSAQRAPASAAVKPASGADGTLPNRGHPTRQLDPKIAALSAGDLPGYRLISSAEAMSSEGGTVPNSWDNLLQQSQPGDPQYRMTEAIVVVYRTVGDAVSGVDLLRQNQESRGVKVSPGLMGGESMTWAEGAGVPGYTLVHSAFRIEHVVAEVTVLGKNSPVLTDELQVVAAAQQLRLLGLLHDSA